jgi:hypothetical protein
MNPTPSLSTAAASSSVALALVVVMVWLLSLAHLAVPDDVSVALGTVFTNFIHWFMTRPNCFNKAPKPEA